MRVVGKDASFGRLRLEQIAEMKSQLVIQVYCDGEESGCLEPIQAAFAARWTTDYTELGTVKFLAPKNLKQDVHKADLGVNLKRIERIRNPDIFFEEITNKIDLGGIEITTHSPDGSNIEKRYPFLWVAGKTNTTAFVATPYLKRRPGGQINRFPRRHANRNLDFLNAWETGAQQTGFLRQFVPIKELHHGDLSLVPADLRKLLLTWEDLGSFFADLLAFKIARGINPRALDRLAQWKNRFLQLGHACVTNATRTAEASTLLKCEDRWIQVYNCRPDSGHWERGEGQFDSIDGRLMFTLDTIEFLRDLHKDEAPTKFEFWLPQMVSTHPWVAEQRFGEFGSKRLRNILVELAGVVTTKFAEQLSSEDWELLEDHNELLLERLDWQPGIYRIQDILQGQNIDKIVRGGMSSVSENEITAIKKEMHDHTLYYSAHRCYIRGWKENFRDCLKRIKGDAIILAPRIPSHLLNGLASSNGTQIVAGEHCTRAQLKMLRQLHRAHLHIKKV